MKTLAQIINNLAYRSGLFSQIQVNMLVEEWDRIFPPPLSEKVRPLEVKEGILFVECVDGVWASELRFAKSSMIEAINRHLQGVRTIRDIRISRRSGHFAQSV